MSSGEMMQSEIVLEKPALMEMLVRVLKKSRLMAPVKRGRVSFTFDWIGDSRQVVTDYVRTILPPKKALVPPREILLEFWREGKQGASPVIDDTPFVLFGVHPCDLAGIEELDLAFAKKNDVKDPHHAARREAVTIIGIDCMPDEYCFCTSVGTNRTRGGADLFLTPVKSGYLVEVLTSKGAALLGDTARTRELCAHEKAEAENWGKEKECRITRLLDVDVARLPDILETQYESEVWERTAKRCYSCGTCTNVCPTCFCFEVDDKVNLPLTAGSRDRRWDSCQFLDFALVAGPHNFRGERPSRVRHRWLRKFWYLYREFGRPFCVGCGRCTQACTAEISLTEVLNEIAGEVT